MNNVIAGIERSSARGVGGRFVEVLGLKRLPPYGQLSEAWTGAGVTLLDADKGKSCTLPFTSIEPKPFPLIVEQLAEQQAQ